MSKPGSYINQFLCVLILAIATSTLFSQSRFLTFEQTSLDKVLKVIEEESDYVFNYEPDLLKEFEFSGKINAANVEEALTAIFYNSPCAFELDQQTVLVYQPGPKTYRICGAVSGYGGEPLIAASIVAVELNAGSLSDESGFFDFELTAVKNQKVEISYLGYQRTSFMVQELKENACPSYELKVDQDLWTEEIVIRDYLLDGVTEGDEFGSFNLDFDKLAENYSTVEHDVLKTAQLLPGINSIDDSATNLQIRGSTPGQNLILWEGVPVYNAGHIFGMISAINPFSVSQVSVFKGAYDPKYDNRVGGIVDISLTDSIENVFHGSLGTTLTEFHTNLDVPVIDDRLALVLSGRQSIGGLYNSPPLNSYTDKVFQFSLIDDQSNSPDQESLNTEQVLSYSDWNAKLIYKVSDRIEGNVGVYANQQDFQYSYYFDGDPFLSVEEISVNTKIINAEFNVELGEGWSGLLSFYNSSYRNENNIQESEDELLTGEFGQLNRIGDESFTLSNVIDLSKALSFNVGYEYNAKKVNLDLGGEVDIDSSLLSGDFERASFHNFFLSAKYYDEKIKIDAGIRTTYYQEESILRYSPRFNLQYLINENLKAKVDAGVYHQFISQLSNFGTRQIRVDNPLWVLSVGDENLSQRANKVAAGFVFKNQGWLVDVDAYYSHTTGLSTVSPLYDLLSRSKGFSRGESSVIGVDALIKKKWSWVNAWINYSYGVTKNKFLEISPNYFYAPNDIRHNISVVSSFKVGKVQFALNANYHSGLPYSRPDLVLNEAEENPGPPFLFFAEYDQFNTRRLKPYLRLDFNVNYRFDFKIHDRLKSEVSLSFINLLNTVNAESRNYFLNYNDDTLIYSLAYAKEVLLDRTPLFLFRLYW